MNPLFELSKLRQQQLLQEARRDAMLHQLKPKVSSLTGWLRLQMLQPIQLRPKVAGSQGGY